MVKVTSYKSKSRSSPRTITLPATKDIRISDGAVLASYGGGPFVSGNVEESIIYGTQNRPRRTSNFCRHNRTITNIVYSGTYVIFRNSIASPTIKTEDNLYPTYSASGSIMAVDAAKVSFGGNFGQTYLVVNGQSLMDQNFDRMRPDLTELSVPNFLLDWTQIGGLWRVWNSRNSLIRNAAQANLTYQYGWRPTLSDIGQMVGAIASLHQKLETWRKSLGKSVRRRVTCVSEGVSARGTGTFAGVGHFDWSGKLTRLVTAHIQYVPLPIRELTNLELVLRGYLDILGFELNPAIIWDKIPFSFVVDWFLQIGPYLERLKLDTLELPIRLEDSYLQYKEHLTVDSTVTNEGIPLQIPKSVYPGAGYDNKFFHRYQFQPSLGISSNLGWRHPSLNQVGLGLSLVLSNAWR